MEVRGSLDIAGLERLSADPTTNLFTGRTYWNTVSQVLRLYDSGIWNTVGALNEASGTVKYELQLDSDLDLSGTTADTINYGYLMYASTSGNDVARTITTPAVASGEFDQVGLFFSSYYFSSMTVQTPDGKLFRLADGTTAATITIQSQEHVIVFYDPDLGAGEWIVTETSEDDESKIGQVKHITANLDMTDFYFTNQKANSSSRFDIPVSIVNDSLSSGTTVTLFDATSTDAFVNKKQIVLYNPTAYTMDVTAFTAQTILNKFTGVSQATWTLAAGKYLVLAKEPSTYEIVDTSDTAISQLSAGGGLVLEVLTGPVTQTLEWGKHYLLDSTGGSSTLTMPATSGLTTVQQEQAKLRVHDISLDWDTNPCTIIPPSGSSIRNGAVDESWVLDSQDTWYLFSRTSDTTISMEHPFTPQIESGGSGTGDGLLNFMENGDFETGTDDWSVSGEFSALSLDLATPLEGSQSLTWTNNEAGGTRGKVEGNLRTVDLGYRGYSAEWTAKIRVVGTGGQYTAYLTKDGTKVDATEIKTTTFSGGAIIPIGAIGTFSFDDSVYKLVVEDVSGTNGDVITIDVVRASTQGQGFSQVNTDYEEADSDITFSSAFDAGSVSIWKKRTGNIVRYVGWMQVGTPTADPLTMTLPYTIDVNKLAFSSDPANTTQKRITGHAYVQNGGTSWSQTNYRVEFGLDTASPTQIYPRITPQSNGTFGGTQTGSTIFVAGQSFRFEFEVPVVGDANATILSKENAIDLSKARFFLSANQTISTTTTTRVEFDDTTYNNIPDAVELDTVTNVGRITFNQRGYYRLFHSQRYTTSFTAEIQSRMAPSGGAPVTIGVSGGNASVNETLHNQDTFFFNAGDYIDCETYHDSGSNKILQGSTQTVFITIEKLTNQTGQGAVGVATDDLADEAERKLLLTYRKGTFVLDNQFTGGELTCDVRQIGDVIYITGRGVPTHSNLSNVTSSVGVVPEWARPLNENKANGYFSGSADTSVRIGTNGQVATFYDVARTDTFFPINISYIIN